MHPNWLDHWYSHNNTLEGQHTSFRVQDWYLEHHMIPFLPFEEEWIQRNIPATHFLQHLQGHSRTVEGYPSE
jgi:hypothetical protein